MKLHSIVNEMTNSSSTTYVFPDEDADKRAKELILKIANLAYNRYGGDPPFDQKDFESLLEVKIVPNKDWITDQKWQREDYITTYKKDREKCSNMTDAEFEHFNRSKTPMSDEEFKEYIQNPENAINYDDGISMTDLVVKLNGEDISRYFNLFTHYNNSEG